LPKGGNIQGDPFARAAHYVRAGGEGDLLWVQNQDIKGWPSRGAVPAEVDWAFTGYSLLRRTALNAEQGQMKTACGLWQQAADYWRQADAPLKEMLRNTRLLMKGACGS
jgi:hypothetical protein